MTVRTYLLFTPILLDHLSRQDGRRALFGPAGVVSVSVSNGLQFQYNGGATDWLAAKLAIMHTLQARTAALSKSQILMITNIGPEYGTPPKAYVGLSTSTPGTSTATLGYTSAYIAGVAGEHYANPMWCSTCQYNQLGVVSSGTLTYLYGGTCVTGNCATDTSGEATTRIGLNWSSTGAESAFYVNPGNNPSVHINEPN